MAEVSSQSSDVLWLQVMNKVIENHPEQKKKWRISARKASECHLCNELGGGALIRCSSEKCNKEYHLDCAHSLGGLLLEDNGILNFHCETHFKPVLFCTCKVKYDESQAMIFCDECCEWYHDTCVGVNPNVAMRLDRFVCTHCKAILKSGKTISKAVKDKNLAKEYQSACHQTAMKAVGLLVELSNGISPLIDNLSVPGRHQSQYSVREMREALDSLSAPPFDVSGVVVAEDEEAPENLIDTIGAQQAVDEWRGRIAQYVTRFDARQDQAEEMFEKASIDLTLSLAPAQLAVVQAVLAEVDRLDQVVTNDIQCVPPECEALYAFQEAVQWMLELLQVIKPLHFLLCLRLPSWYTIILI